MAFAKNNGGNLIYSANNKPDNEIIEGLIQIHWPNAKRIVDVTCNRRRFWKGSKRKVVCMDINPDVQPDIIGDYRFSPLPDETFDLVIFDPPHLPNGSKTEQAWNQRFGLTDEKQEVDVFDLFFQEAKRYTRKRSRIFLKTCDFVQGRANNLQLFNVERAARAHGFRIIDLIIKIRRNKMLGQWENQNFAWKNHSYWVVLKRNSSRLGD